MAYVVNDKCIRCKYMDCVEVCPVGCFREGANMLVINPDQCIDCGVCEEECPAGAIKSGNHEEGEEWVEFNAQYAQKWPPITEKHRVPPDANTWKDVENKFSQFFDPTPGVGDEVPEKNEISEKSNG